MLMPRAFRLSMMHWGKRMSLKDLIGGGSSSPSQRMCHLSRVSCLCSSVIARTCDGGVQPVSIDCEYVMPVASSCTDMSGLKLESIDERI